MPDDYATIEHVTSRVNGARPIPGCRLLACKLCNEKRGADEIAALSAEERRRRSRGPKDIPPARPPPFRETTPGCVIGD